MKPMLCTGCTGQRLELNLPVHHQYLGVMIDSCSLLKIPPLLDDRTAVEATAVVR